MAEVRIQPITPDRFGDLVDLFGTRGDPSWCWCQFFLTTGNAHVSAESNRTALRAQVATARRTVGLIAYAADDTPASTFGAAGFEVIGRTGPSRPVMRLDLRM